ncbi:hypothetical protein ABVT39_016407 [Epinephelus coioides]
MHEAIGQRPSVRPVSLFSSGPSSVKSEESTVEYHKEYCTRLEKTQKEENERDNAWLQNSQQQMDRMRRTSWTQTEVTCTQLSQFSFLNSVGPLRTYAPNCTFGKCTSGKTSGRKCGYLDRA